MTKYRRDIMLTDQDWEVLSLLGNAILANKRFSEDEKASLKYNGRLSRSAIIRFLIARVASAYRLQVDPRQIPERNQAPRRVRQ